MKKLNKEQKDAVEEVIDMYIPKRKVDGKRLLKLKLSLGILTTKEFDECWDILHTPKKR